MIINRLHMTLDFRPERSDERSVQKILDFFLVIRVSAATILILIGHLTLLLAKNCRLSRANTIHGRLDSLLFEDNAVTIVEHKSGIRMTVRINVANLGISKVPAWHVDVAARHRANTVGGINCHDIRRFSSRGIEGLALPVIVLTRESHARSDCTGNSNLYLSTLDTSELRTSVAMRGSLSGVGGGINNSHSLEGSDRIVLQFLLLCEVLEVPVVGPDMVAGEISRLETLGDDERALVVS